MFLSSRILHPPYDENINFESLQLMRVHDLE